MSTTSLRCGTEHPMLACSCCSGAGCPVLRSRPESNRAAPLICRPPCSSSPLPSCGSSMPCMNEPVTTSMASASMGDAARLQSGRDAGEQPLRVVHVRKRTTRSGMWAIVNELPPAFVIPTRVRHPVHIHVQVGLSHCRSTFISLVATGSPAAGASIGNLYVREAPLPGLRQQKIASGIFPYTVHYRPSI